MREAAFLHEHQAHLPHSLRELRQAIQKLTLRGERGTQTLFRNCGLRDRTWFGLPEQVIALTCSGTKYNCFTLHTHLAQQILNSLLKSHRNKCSITEIKISMNGGYLENCIAVPWDHSSKGPHPNNSASYRRPWFWSLDAAGWICMLPLKCCACPARLHWSAKSFFYWHLSLPATSISNIKHPDSRWRGTLSSTGTYFHYSPH